MNAWVIKVLKESVTWYDQDDYLLLLVFVMKTNYSTRKRTAKTWIIIVQFIENRGSYNRKDDSVVLHPINKLYYIEQYLCYVYTSYLINYSNR